MGDVNRGRCMIGKGHFPDKYFLFDLPTLRGELANIEFGLVLASFTSVMVRNVKAGLGRQLRKAHTQVLADVALGTICEEDRLGPFRWRSRKPMKLAWEELRKENLSSLRSSVISWEYSMTTVSPSRIRNMEPCHGMPALPKNSTMDSWKRDIRNLIFPSQTIRT